MAFAELKARQSIVWGNGPYERITNTIRDIHTLVIERSDPKPGERVLDAATGTGALAIIAAKRGAEVIGQDLARFSSTPHASAQPRRTSPSSSRSATPRTCGTTTRASTSSCRHAA